MTDADDFESQVLAFERAWQASTVPSLDEFLSSSPAEFRQRLLVELICIDLEYRWKCSHKDDRSVRPLTLESYVATFPELGSLDSFPLTLIEEEYRVRQRWGDRPTFTEIVARFGPRRHEVEEALIRVDRELRSELWQVASLPVDRTNIGSPSKGPDSRAPLAFRDYALQELIGAGRTGKVYRALQRSLDRRVAVKYLRKSLMQQPAAVERFIEEAKTIARFQHPGMVSIHGLGKTRSSYFMAMDLIDGPDLATVVRQGVVSITDAIAWTTQACGAIEHAHQQGVVHCDLKPGNLLLDREGRVYVTDFGFARVLTDNTWAKVRIEGTAPFMAPEQASSFWGPISPRTDVYGLGAVLFALLTGRPPWQGHTLAHVLSQVVSAMPAPPIAELRADIPPSVAEICARCLAKCPVDRYATAAELRNALLDVLANRSGI